MDKQQHHSNQQNATAAMDLWPPLLTDEHQHTAMDLNGALPPPPSFAHEFGVLPSPSPSPLEPTMYGDPQPPAPLPMAFLDDLLDHSDAEDDDFRMRLSPAAPPSDNPVRMSMATSRLLQLETNYERKKKRAKINRKDLNARFQELMEILHLKEDRKLNRAKVLEKTIEHIHKLTAELQHLKAQQKQQRQPQQPQPHQPQLVPKQTMAQVVPDRPSAIRPPASIVRSQPPPQQWSGVVPPMVWLPCAVLTASSLKEPANGVLTSTPRQQQRQQLKRTRAKQSVFIWIAQEIPGFLMLCDAWTLAALMQMSKELQLVANQSHLWRQLCIKRWAIPRDVAMLIPNGRLQWTQWHETNRIPHCTSLESGGTLFAAGSAQRVHVWGILARRSNGRTTRTVLVDGKAAVMQVVECHVVIQNLSHVPIQLTDHIHITTATTPFQPFAAGSGAHLMPQVISSSGSTDELATMTLWHGDMCTLSVFLRCDGLDLEQDVLERAQVLCVSCVSASSQPIAIQAKSQLVRSLKC